MKLTKICVFCSACEVKEYLDLGYQVGKTLAQNGFTTITGGGPGVMNTVNQGAFEHKGESWAIQIAKEPFVGTFYTKTETHQDFGTQNKRILEIGDAFLVLPGGLGTILEFLAITQRKKFGELKMNTPMILLGNFYQKLNEFIKEIEQKGFIKEPLNLLYQFAQTPDEAITLLKSYQN
ncbi:LOG family protein [Candidatus Beckwithbacteria bacterium]|nr:LOG family protein [Candidatus Beckwithbacteria bacterium]